MPSFMSYDPQVGEFVVEGEIVTENHKYPNVEMSTSDYNRLVLGVDDNEPYPDYEDQCEADEPQPVFAPEPVSRTIRLPHGEPVGSFLSYFDDDDVPF